MYFGLCGVCVCVLCRRRQKTASPFPSWLTAQQRSIQVELLCAATGAHGAPYRGLIYMACVDVHTYVEHSCEGALIFALTPGGEGGL